MTRLAKTILLPLFLSVLPSFFSVQADDPENRPTAFITLTRQPDGISVAYRFSEPVARMEFFQQDTAQRRKSWRFVGAPDLIVANGAVTSIDSHDLTEFALLIEPDQAFGDDAEIGLVPIGKSGFLLSSGLVLARPDAFENRLCVQDKPGVCADFDAEPAYYRVNASGIVDIEAMRYRVPIYLGDADFEETLDYRLLLDPAIPDDVRASLKDMMSRFADFYRDRLAYEFEEVPTLLAGWDASSAQADWRTRGYPYGIMAVSFRGDIFDDKQALMLRNITTDLSETMSLDFGFERLNPDADFVGYMYYVGLVRAIADETTRVVAGNVVGPRRMFALNVDRCLLFLNGRVPEDSEYQGRRQTLPCFWAFHQLAGKYAATRTRGKADLTSIVVRAMEGEAGEDAAFSASYRAALRDYDPDGHLVAFLDALVEDDRTKAAKALNGALVGLVRLMPDE
ncbi:MAG: hypothetical protein EP335_05380 [Alphaproteobacteria bacterium]|nr:MAG: hypothetical protein EP335_05380 [Alphaproteobacteria bacterium]